MKDDRLLQVAFFGVIGLVVVSLLVRVFVVGNGWDGGPSWFFD